MSTHIQLHRSSVAGATPDVASMLEGEPAVNLTDNKLYIKGPSNNLKLFPTGVSSVNGSTGDISLTDLVGVGTFNGASGDVQAVGTFNGSTGDVQGVGTFNGSTGDIQAVGTFNGLTGTVDTSTLLIHANGISADGATFGGNIIVGGGATLSGQLNAQAGVSASSLSINNAYSLPSADGSAGQVMMSDGADAVSFQTIKFMANFVLDSDVPLATGIRDKAIYYIPSSN